MKITVARTITAPVSWGTTYVVVTEVLPPGRPLLEAAVRVLPAGLLLVLLARWVPRGAQWRRVAVLGLTNFGLFFPLLIVAASLLPGGVAAAAGGLQPLLVLGLTALLDRRRPSGRQVAVGVGAAIGVALVVLRPGAGYSAAGLLAAVGANVSFAAGVVLTRRQPAPANAIGDTGWQLLASAVLIVPVALLVEGAPPVVTAVQVTGFAYFSLVATAVAFLLWFDGVRRLPVIAPPLLGLAAPLTGVVVGWLLLGQAMTPVQLGGFVMTAGAIAYGALSGRDRAERGVSARAGPRRRRRRDHVRCSPGDGSVVTLRPTGRGRAAGRVTRGRLAP